MNPVVRQEEKEVWNGNTLRCLELTNMISNAAHTPDFALFDRYTEMLTTSVVSPAFIEPNLNLAIIHAQGQHHVCQVFQHGVNILRISRLYTRFPLVICTIEEGLIING